jgi:DNA polymerase (family 10)
MDNYAIADNFSMLSKLMDIHGDDSFKAKSYSITAFTVENLPVQLSTLPADKMFAIKGIGQSMGKKILEQFETGRLALLDDYILRTPPGVIEMMKIKGIGPKKISTIWKELGVESIGELLYACEENRLLLYKGFGAKTQQNIKESIQFYMNNLGSYLFSQVEPYAKEITRIIAGAFPDNQFITVGHFNRNGLVVHKLEWVTDADIQQLKTYFEEKEYSTEETSTSLVARGPENVTLEFHITTTPLLHTKAFEHNSGPEFITKWKEQFGWDEGVTYNNEEEIFAKHKLQFVPHYLRDMPHFIEHAINNKVPEVIQPSDIRAIIHSHSEWSDGSDTIEAMAKGCIKRGLEYLVISDHSQSAYYAKGLQPDRIKAQHQLIDELNKKYAPFKIFKSIESDILNDGSLDYPDEILATFDLVITSVHSNFKMTEEKATSRIITAISNPFTTIMGHLTGRLLLSRNGYPVDHKAVLDACAEHNVVIEINAHPRRLDIDYTYIPYAIEKGVLVSIDPDAHAVDAFEDVRYGVLAAQKGGLTKEHNLSSFSLQQFEEFLAKQQFKRSGR